MMPSNMPDPSAKIAELERRIAALEQLPVDIQAQNRSFTANEGQHCIVECPVAGLTATLPKARPQNRNARITFTLRNSNPVRFIAVNGKVNSRSSGVMAAPGTFDAISDGVTGWYISVLAAGPTATTPPLGADFVVGVANPGLPNARAATASVEITPSIAVANVISWALNASSVVFAKLQNLTGLSVLGRAPNSSGVMAAIAASGSFQHLRSDATGSNLEWASPTVSSPITVTGETFGFDQTAALGNNARVAVAKNSGATVGTRRQINLIEGANVTLTEADDPGNERVNVTIASTGGGGGGTTLMALTVVQVDLGATPVQNGRFTISGLSGLSVGARVFIQQATGAYSGKGGDDELQLDAIICAGIVATSTTITVDWHSEQFCQGIVAFQYAIGNTITFANLPDISPGQFIGLNIDAGASGPPIAITGAQGGENIRFNSWVIDSASAGNLTDYALALGTTGVSFQGTVVANLQGIQLAVGGNSGNPMFFTTANSSRVSLEHEAPGEATASRRLRVPGSISASLLANETALLLDDTSVSRRRVVAFARARSAAQANGGAISPAETLNFKDSANADFLPTLSVTAGVASISANLGYASQAVFDAGFASALPLASNLRGFPGSFCSNLAAITTINSVARNATLGVTPGGGIAVLQSIPAVAVANAGQAYLLYGFFTVARGGNGTAANITWDAQCAGVTQTEVPGVPIPVTLNARYGGMMLALLHIETLGVAGTATLRAFGGAGSLTQAFSDLASSGSLVTPFTINTTVPNTVSLGMTMSAAVPNLQTSWNSCGIIKLYV